MANGLGYRLTTRRAPVCASWSHDIHVIFLVMVATRSVERGAQTADDEISYPCSVDCVCAGRRAKTS